MGSRVAHYNSYAVNGRVEVRPWDPRFVPARGKSMLRVRYRLSLISRQSRLERCRNQLGLRSAVRTNGLLGSRLSILQTSATATSGASFGTENSHDVAGHVSAQQAQNVSKRRARKPAPCWLATP